MNNLFPAHKDIHETYDLKGSTVGRLYPEERARENPRAVLKDLNWIDRHKELELGPEKRALFTEQLRRDTELLKELHVMDYSLLIGIHNMRRGNRDNVRRNTLRVYSPPDVHVSPQPHAQGLHRRRGVSSATPDQPYAARRTARLNACANLKSVGEGVLPEEDTGDRQQFLFYQDEGGLRATDEQNKPLDTVYYLGVIDILTPYGVIKRVEHLWKGMSADRVWPLLCFFFFGLGHLIDVGCYSTRSVRCRRPNTRTASSRLCVPSCVVAEAARVSRPNSRPLGTSQIFFYSLVAFPSFLFMASHSSHRLSIARTALLSIFCTHQISCSPRIPSLQH